MALLVEELRGEMMAAEACLASMDGDGRAWDCDRRALARVRLAMTAGRDQQVLALRAAEASLTEMDRDNRATTEDVRVLGSLREALSRADA